MRVICAENDPRQLKDLERIVSSIMPDAEVRGCGSPEEAEAVARSGGCDVLLTEIDLEGNRSAGCLLAQRVREICPGVSIIFVTSRALRASDRQNLPLGTGGVLTKPFSRDRLAEELAGLRFPVEEPPLRPSRAGGGVRFLGYYEPGVYQEESKAFFRRCVGDETYELAMNSDVGRRHHYVPARIILSQPDWEKFCWIERFGSLEGFPV